MLSPNRWPTMLRSLSCSPPASRPLIRGAKPSGRRGRSSSAPGRNQSTKSATESKQLTPRILSSCERALKCCVRDALAVSAEHVDAEPRTQVVEQEAHLRLGPDPDDTYPQRFAGVLAPDPVELRFEVGA